MRTLGRVGHQKRIRRLIRLISYVSPIHSAVWAECYARWRAISQPVYDALNEELNGSTNMRHAFMDQQQVGVFLPRSSYRHSRLCAIDRSFVSSGRISLSSWLPSAVPAQARSRTCRHSSMPSHLNSSLIVSALSNTSQPWQSRLSVT
jgi:hypothetical protein